MGSREPKEKGDQMDQDYNRPEFVRETIKKKPVNMNKLLRRTFLTIAMAVIFGAFACLTFLLMEPVIGNIINPKEIPKVSFPEEEVPVDQLLTEESKAQKDKEDQQAVLAEAKEVARKTAEESRQYEEEETSLQRYANIYEELSNLAANARGYLVTVVSSQEREDWLMGSYESQKSFSGLIVADNSQSIFILADMQGENADKYSIVFQDGSYVESQILQFDSQTDLAVFAIDKSALPSSIRSSVMPAPLGNSYDTNLLGKPVIAVGSPQGISNSLAYGVITSNTAKLQLTDADYGVILTDIAAYPSASGYLLDLKGNVVGVVLQKAQNESYGGLAVVGISELKALIAKLSNNEPRAYLGVRGNSVTRLIHEQMNVPYGVFVTEVEAGSPAMQAGIRNGDIIVQAGNISVSSFTELRTALLSCDPQDTLQVKLLRQTGNEYQEISTEVFITTTE